jgi:hypothetical protein
VQEAAKALRSIDEILAFKDKIERAAEHQGSRAQSREEVSRFATDKVQKSALLSNTVSALGEHSACSEGGADCAYQSSNSRGKQLCSRCAKGTGVSQKQTAQEQISNVLRRRVVLRCAGIPASITRLRRGYIHRPHSNCFWVSKLQKKRVV